MDPAADPPPLAPPPTPLFSASSARGATPAAAGSRGAALVQRPPLASHVCAPRWLLTSAGPAPRVTSRKPDSRFALASAGLQCPVPDRLRRRAAVLYAAPLERGHLRRARCSESPCEDPLCSEKQPRCHGATNEKKENQKGEEQIPTSQAAASKSERGDLRSAYRRAIAHCARADEVLDAQGLMLDMAWRERGPAVTAAPACTRLQGDNPPSETRNEEQLLTALKGFDRPASAFILKDSPGKQSLIKRKDNKKNKHEGTKKSRKKTSETKPPSALSSTELATVLLLPPPEQRRGDREAASRQPPALRPPGSMRGWPEDLIKLPERSTQQPARRPLGPIIPRAPTYLMKKVRLKKK